MTDKQRIFCDEYLIDLNATRAYMAAYPNVKNENSAAARSSKIMKENQEIKDYIRERLDAISSEKIAKTEEVLQYLTSVLRGQSEAEEIVIEGLGEGMSEARAMTKGPSEKDKLKAAELLGKAYGLYTDKLKVDNQAEEEKAKKLDNIQSILDQMKPVQDGD